MPDHPAQERFNGFVADQQPAIDELRTFCGGELGPRLDLTLGSLELLDEFVGNLLQSGLDENPLFRYASTPVRTWLTVRLAYYLAAVIAHHLPGEWRLENAQPVLDLASLHINPLEVAHAYLNDELENGLAGFYADLALEVAKAP